MSDEQQAVAAKRTRKPTRVPGETGPDEQQAVAADGTGPGLSDEADEHEDAQAARHSLPDFRHKSSAYAAKWYRDNPKALKRAVLCSDGWYVHPDCFKNRAGGESKGE